MSPDIQVKLLRALETRMVRRLGGKREIQVDIRIVAATNKDLQKAIVDGELREDLFYRLAVVEIDLPPLRERGSDVQLLAREFLQRFAKANGKKLDGFDDAALEWINTYHWPGNVRELRNAVEKAVIMARGSRVTIDDLASRRHRTTGEFATVVSVPVGSSLADTRRVLVLKTFANANGDLLKTAKTVGITVNEARAELQALLERRGSDQRPGSPADRTLEAAADAPPVDAGVADAPVADAAVADSGGADGGAAQVGSVNGAAVNGAAVDGTADAGDAAATNGVERGGATRAVGAGGPPPVVLPADAPTPVGKAPKTPARARRGG
jgi:hypothetical protein